MGGALTRLRRRRRRQPILRGPFRICRFHQSSLNLPSLSGARVFCLPVTWIQAQGGSLRPELRGRQDPAPSGEWGFFCKSGTLRASHSSHRVSLAGAALGMGLGSDLGVYSGAALIYPRALRVQAPLLQLCLPPLSGSHTEWPAYPLQGLLNSAHLWGFVNITLQRLLHSLRSYSHTGPRVRPYLKCLCIGRVIETLRSTSLNWKRKRRLPSA